MIEAKVIEDSVSEGYRITTLEVNYPRFILAEFNTHRMFSRSSMSSRAIPVAKMIEQVRNNPAMPVQWGANRPGMQALEELTGADLTAAQFRWRLAAHNAADVAEEMAKTGLHKQVANRVLEPFQWMRTIVTATEWDNFFKLRCHPDAQPEFQTLARLMQRRREESVPTERRYREVGEKAWHLPYVRENERGRFRLDILLKLSTARCARVSYMAHDGTEPDVDKDLALYERLVGSVPRHSSPAEHQARANHSPSASNNFRGWVQHRRLIDTGATPS